MQTKISEKLNTLSEDAQQAAVTKAKELSFDLNKGSITIDESFINLNADVAMLQGAIKEDKLSQLPLSVQSSIFEGLEKVAGKLTGLANGTDEVVNLVDAIEAVHASLWQIGLQELSPSYFGYETKLNQVKHLEVEIRKLKLDLEAGLAIKSNLELLGADAKTLKESLAAQLLAAEGSVTASATQLAKTVESEQKSSAIVIALQLAQTTAAENLSKTTTSWADISALEVKVKEFYRQVELYRAQITTTTEDAGNTIATNKAETKTLIAELDELKNQIKDQIRRATGHSLFHSFQTRQEMLAGSKRFWIGALFLLIAVSVGFSIWLSMSTTSYNVAFFIKLSITIPLAFAIGFCAVQYSRERRLEEEYAFKSSISISLIPYQELVEKLVDKDKADQKERFTTFVIESVTNVFTSPTDKIFDTVPKEKDSSNIDKSIKRIVSLVKPLIKGGRY